MITNKRIFITGGGGFIGSWICKQLAKDNEIIVYDNARRDALKFLSFTDRKNLTVIKGDIRNRSCLIRSIPKDVNIVLHLAAIAGVSSYYRIPLETMEVNLIGTYNILEALKNNKKIEIFIDFSTSEIYGGYAKNIKEEDETTQGAISDLRWTYAISKLAAEKISHCYYHKYNFPVASIRPFNIYGPRQVGEGAIQIFISKALRGEDIEVHGSGLQVRAWCYIEDFIDAVVQCIVRKKKSIGMAFNVGNPGSKATILELARKIVRLTSSSSRILFKRPQRTDIEYRVPDISRAKRMLGFSPKVDLIEGLNRTIEWYRQNKI